MAKILCYRSGGIWDFITTIPKRYQIKENGDELYLLRYSSKFKGKLYLFSEFDKIPLYIWLAKGIIEIPYNKFKLLRFCIKNFHRFDKFYMPIKTKYGYLLWKILSKRAEYTFENQRDISKYKNIIEWEIWNWKLLSDYKEFFDSYIDKECKIKDKYICIYPSDITRSLKNEDWIDLIKHILSNYKYKIVLLWWGREKRFSKIVKEHFNKELWKNIIDKIWQINLKETGNLLKYSIFNISCNGWVMRYWCILNENNITIQIKSANVYRPPEDWKHTICITQNECKRFCDGECKYKWTNKDHICKNINLQKIINQLDKIIKNLQTN